MMRSVLRELLSRYMGNANDPELGPLFHETWEMRTLLAAALSAGDPSINSIWPFTSYFAPLWRGIFAQILTKANRLKRGYVPRDICHHRLRPLFQKPSFQPSSTYREAKNRFF